jgi:hypothetical protein
MYNEQFKKRREKKLRIDLFFSIIIFIQESRNVFLHEQTRVSAKRTVNMQ